jgi:integrase
VTMAGRRPLTRSEERKLLRTVRKLAPRDRALVTAQWFTGFRIHEILSLTVGHVWREGAVASKIGVAPRFLKGGYGRTRWIPVLPELHRALETHLTWLWQRFEVTPSFPLFPSRQVDRNGNVRPLTRVQAYHTIKRAFSVAQIEDDGRLGTHSLRKTFAKSVWLASGRDILVVNAALCHTSVSTSERYLETDEGSVMAAIARCDFTRRRTRPEASSPTPIADPSPAVAA